MDAQTDKVLLHHASSQAFDAPPTIPELSDNNNIHLQDIAPKSISDDNTPEMTIHALPSISLEPVSNDIATPPIQSAAFSEHSMPSHTFSNKQESGNNAQQTTTWTTAHGNGISNGAQQTTTLTTAQTHQQQPTLSDDTFLHDGVKPSTTEKQREIAEPRSSFVAESTHASSADQLVSLTSNMNVETSSSIAEKGTASLQQLPALSTASSSSVHVAPVTTSSPYTGVQTFTDNNLHDDVTEKTPQKDFNSHAVSAINIEPSGTVAAAPTFTQEQNQNASSVQQAPLATAFQSIKSDAHDVAPSTQSQQPHPPSLTTVETSIQKVNTVHDSQW